MKVKFLFLSLFGLCAMMLTTGFMDSALDADSDAPAVANENIFFKKDGSSREINESKAWFLRSAAAAASVGATRRRGRGWWGRHIGEVR